MFINLGGSMYQKLMPRTWYDAITYYLLVIPLAFCLYWINRLTEPFRDLLRWLFSVTIIPLFQFLFPAQYRLFIFALLLFASCVYLASFIS